MLIHSVYFWLKPGLTPGQRAHFLEEVKKLPAIAQIERCYIGGPATIAEREVTDRSFDVGMTVVFKNGAAHDAYQVDPIHLAFVAANKESWTRVQVFDSEG
jgi:hypothetical protein